MAGAPLTNLTSMHLSVYGNSGGTDARIFEISQGRMEVPFWEDTESYIANSPVFHVDKLNTPLMVAHGTEDGAVDYNQGVEYDKAARRAGKDFVLLVYNGENHGNRQKPNQPDYHRHIIQWFGHYLEGEPAEEWITDGLSYEEQQRSHSPLPTPHSLHHQSLRQSIKQVNVGFLNIPQPSNPRSRPRLHHHVLVRRVRARAVSQSRENKR